ncbi:molybdopterin oxidoreductase family protein [Mycobacterium xenopi 4042]|uniref:Molybdopterin oxidoreductase family protein n=1 Tax=Mycobacterium xenopi 4042 TaxID=1299334 RepID=X7ZUV4_MYCXE|nr:molybdopterin oxidoreductase family protein [Mycobacterium xenopi 4042]
MLRRLAGDDPEVNEEWNCDKGRWAFTYATQPDRITTPLVRDAQGSLIPASWPQALQAAADGWPRPADAQACWSAARDAGGRLRLRQVRTDRFTHQRHRFPARPHSAEEAEFLAARIAGKPMTVTYSALESAPVVLLAGFEPEDESPIVFLRLRKAARKHGLPVYAIAPFASHGLEKMWGRVIKTVPGAEASALEQLPGEVGNCCAGRAR